MTHPEQHPPLILVVDDDVLLRIHAADVLEEAGYRVVEAADAPSALKILETQPNVRLLFTDVQMPGGFDGLALAEQVHKRWPHVLLLVTSSNLKLTDDAIPDGGRFMPKPYDEDTVVNRVADLISAHPEGSCPPPPR